MRRYMGQVIGGLLGGIIAGMMNGIIFKEVFDDEFSIIFIGMLHGAILGTFIILALSGSKSVNNHSQIIDGTIGSIAGGIIFLIIFAMIVEGEGGDVNSLFQIAIGGLMHAPIGFGFTYGTLTLKKRMKRHNFLSKFIGGILGTALGGGLMWSISVTILSSLFFFLISGKDAIVAGFISGVCGIICGAIFGAFLTTGIYIGAKLQNTADIWDEDVIIKEEEEILVKKEDLKDDE